MNTKQCRQCGEIKPIEQYRRYYGGRQGTYTICRSCERINSRVKYLERKGPGLSDAEKTELDKIYKLYEAQRACGLRPPKRDGNRRKRVSDDLDDMLEAFMGKVAAASSTPLAHCAPTDLTQWLSRELTEKPDYYLDEVYEELKARYRPVLRIDTASMLPVYDDTYASTLELILDRFNKYEDDYYQED